MKAFRISIFLGLLLTTGIVFGKHVKTDYDLVDPASNQLIWRGRVTDTVKGLDQSDKQINKGVDELVKHFVKDEKKNS